MAKTIVKMDSDAIVAHVMGEWEKALPLLTEEILNDCNQYCKKDTGMLIESSHRFSKPEKGLMVWNTAYAKRQYWEIKTAYTDVNPNATYKWVHYAKSKHQKQWVKQAAKLMGVKNG